MGSTSLFGNVNQSHSGGTYVEVSVKPSGDLSAAECTA